MKKMFVLMLALGITVMMLTGCTTGDSMTTATEAPTTQPTVEATAEATVEATVETTAEPIVGGADASPEATAEVQG